LQKKFNPMKTKFLFVLTLLFLVLSSCKKNDSLVTTSPENNLLKSAALKQKYIVMFKGDTAFQMDDSKQKDRVKNQALNLLGKYRIKGDVGQVLGRLQGFSVYLSDDQATQLANDPQIKVVGKDYSISLPKGEMTAVKQSSYAAQGSNYVPWGITRVGGPVTYTGSNEVWILDTGILLTHPDLNVDAGRGRSFIPTEPSPTDYNAHGTHVAGIIAAIDNDMYVVGVAAGARVIPVKVLDGNGNGTLETILAGLDYVAANGKEGDVANMSLNGPASAVMDSAIIAASAKVKFVVAAGNEAQNVAYYSPARVDGKNILTISAMGPSDSWAPFSNFGMNVDYCAPGIDVLSLYKEEGYWMWANGTSAAAPHVAGLWLLGKIKHDGTVINDPDLVSDRIAYIWK
jgi:subtilisin family serine protease